MTQTDVSQTEPQDRRKSVFFAETEVQDRGEEREREREREREGVGVGVRVWVCVGVCGVCVGCV